MPGSDGFGGMDVLAIAYATAGDEAFGMTHVFTHKAT